MKRLMMLLITSLILQVAVAQLGKIPSEVTTGFAAKYPTAKDVQWKNNLSDYTVKFTSANSTKCKASFNGKGEWQSTEEELDSTKLPAPVKDGLSKSKYADRELKETMKIEKKSGDVQYRLLMKKNDVEKKYVYFNKEGKLVKESMTL
jgi:hypothetical protein